MYSITGLKIIGHWLYQGSCKIASNLHWVTETFLALACPVAFLRRQSVVRGKLILYLHLNCFWLCVVEGDNDSWWCWSLRWCSGWSTMVSKIQEDIWIYSAIQIASVSCMYLTLAWSLVSSVAGNSIGSYVLIGWVEGRVLGGGRSFVRVLWGK
jgi:hypothetical protein